MEADDDNEPTWLVVVIVVCCLKKKDEKTHPVSQLQARGWVVGLSWVQTEADDDNEHGLSSSSFVALKKRRKETHPIPQLQARGWVRIGRKKPTPACSCMQGGGLLSSCVVLLSSVISNVS